MLRASAQNRDMCIGRSNDDQEQHRSMRKTSVAIFGLMLAVIARQSVAAGGTNTLIPYATSDIRIDGALMESSWETALSLGPFTGPIDLATNEDAILAVNRTDVKLLWRGDNLFVAFLCRSPRPAWATYTNHDDPLYQQDVCEVFLRAKRGLESYAEFEASPLGTTFDLYRAWVPPPTFPANRIDWNQVRNRKDDLAWNPPGLTAASRLLKEGGQTVGWVIELAISLAVVREREGLDPRLVPGQVVWLNLLRYVYEPDANGQRHLHPQNWSPVMRGCPHVSPMAMRPLELATDQ